MNIVEEAVFKISVKLSLSLLEPLLWLKKTHNQILSNPKFLACLFVSVRLVCFCFLQFFLQTDLNFLSCLQPTYSFVCYDFFSISFYFLVRINVLNTFEYSHYLTSLFNLFSFEIIKGSSYVCKSLFLKSISYKN